MISPGYFKEWFEDTFGLVAYVLEHCGIYFSVFLFFKLILYVLVMVIRLLEVTKMIGASLGFGKTLLSASYNIFLLSVLTSIDDSRAPTLAAVEEERKTLCNEESYKIWEKIPKKGRSYLSCNESGPVYSSRNSNFPCLNFFLNLLFRLHYTQYFLHVTMVFQSSLTQKKTSNPVHLLVWTSPLILSLPSYLLSLLLQKYLPIQFRLRRHPPHLYDPLTIPKT